MSGKNWKTDAVNVLMMLSTIVILVLAVVPGVFTVPYFFFPSDTCCDNMKSVLYAAIDYADENDGLFPCDFDDMRDPEQMSESLCSSCRQSGEPYIILQGVSKGMGPTMPFILEQPGGHKDGTIRIGYTDGSLEEFKCPELPMKFTDLFPYFKGAPMDKVTEDYLRSELRRLDRLMPEPPMNEEVSKSKGLLAGIF